MSSYPIAAINARREWLAQMATQIIGNGAPVEETYDRLMIDAPETLEAYYLGEEPYQLTFHAADSYPAATVFRPELPYTPNGFLYPQWPIGSHTDPGATTVDALMWIHQADGCLIIPCVMREGVPSFDRLIWKMGETLAEAELRAGGSEDEPRPGPSIFHLLGAFWALCRQRIFTAERALLPRGQRRQLAKEFPGIPGPRVVVLRASERRTTAVTGSGRQLETRHIRSGHWRDQWYGSDAPASPKGPRRQEPLWLGPTVIGPAGAPLLHPQAQRLFSVIR